MALILRKVAIMKSKLTESSSYNEEEFKNLIELLSSGDKDKKAYAVVRLSGLGKSVVAPLIELFRYKDYASIWLDVSGILGYIGTPALEPLLNALKDKNSSVRMGAAAALGSLSTNDARAVRPLIDALEDRAKQVRASAARALARFRSIEALEPLLNSLSDSDSNVPRATAYSLGEIPDERAIAALVKLLDSEDPELQVIAMETLSRIGDSSILERVEVIEQQGKYVWLRKAASEATSAIKRGLEA